MTLLDRTPETLDVIQGSAAPAGDAHLAACALHLLLAQHPELVDLPFEWRITADGTVRPGLPVDDPQGRDAVQLLAKALELDAKSDRFTTREGGQCDALTITGRWGGAMWQATVYVPAEGGDRS